MAKSCPNCNKEIEITSLSCSCGYVFVEEIEMTRSAQLESVHHIRKDRIIKRTVILTCCAAFALTFAAWVGGFISTSSVVADSDVSNASSEPQPLANVPQPQAAALSPRFPESNIPYTAVKAVTGSVFEVTDAAGQGHRVSIHGIRVPKLDENFGHESKASLSTFVIGKPVMIKLRRFTKDVDTIAEVFADGSNIGLEQIKTGMAWLVPEEIAGLSEPEQRDYLDAAIAARSGKLGIWSGKKGVDPSTGEPGTWNAAPIKMDFPVDPLTVPATRNAEPVNRKPASIVDSRQYDAPPQDQTPANDPTSVPREVVRIPVEVPNDAVPTPAVRPKTSGSKRTYIRGPFGGCYYINSSGNKSYVDRSACD